MEDIMNADMIVLHKRGAIPKGLEYVPVSERWGHVVIHDDDRIIVWSNGHWLLEGPWQEDLHGAVDAMFDLITAEQDAFQAAAVAKYEAAKKAAEEVKSG